MPRGAQPSADRKETSLVPPERTTLAASLNSPSTTVMKFPASPMGRDRRYSTHILANCGLAGSFMGMRINLGSKIVGLLQERIDPRLRNLTGKSAGMTGTWTP